MDQMDITKIWVVIAAYNEDEVIAATVANTLLYVNNVIVVDDCSFDDTAHKAGEAGAYVLCHLINLGQGAALQTGIEFALGKGAEYIVTFDADGQHNANELLPMLLALQQSQSDVALGSRFLGKASNLPWQRRWLLKLIILMAQVTQNSKLTDVHNGFRVLSRRFCEQFVFQQNRMAHASEIINYIASCNVKYIEFPVTITYTEYSIRKGQRGVNAFRIVMELIMGYVSK